MKVVQVLRHGMKNNGKMTTTMKKILFFAAVAAFAAVSCVKENYNVEGEKFVIKAAMSDTKTVLSEGTKTLWTPSDELTVFNAGKVNCQFTTNITENAAVASFSAESFEAPETFHAFYPYNKAIATSDFQNFTGLEIPSVQKAVENGFDPAAALCYATGQSTDLAFQNLTALLKFTINADEIYNVRIYASSKISGTCSFNGTTLAASNNQVQVKGLMRKGKTFYMAVAPGTYSSLSVFVNNEPYSAANRENKTLEAGKIYDMGLIATTRRTVVDWYYASDIPSSITAEDIPESYRSNINDVNASDRDKFQQADSYGNRGARYKVWYVSEDGTTLTCGDDVRNVDDVNNRNRDGQHYAILYSYYGMPMYFNIDWETKYNGEANKFPLVDMRDRKVQYTWQLNRSYYDASTRTVVIDLASSEGNQMKLFHGKLSKTK